MLELADGFRQNALVCLPQDLHTLYVYWDFTPQRIQNLHDFFSIVKPEMKLTLRLRRLDALLPEQELTLTTLEPGGCYFYNLEAHTGYYVELGAISQAGEFVLFTRTPVPHTQLVGKESPTSNFVTQALTLGQEWTILLEEPPDRIFSWS
ncbi:Uncharacterized [Moorella glycerini]|uniref:DUF4912 domain-containing protein n=1 Tax=Neomoorella stamsii TaxID=1266720 RepID=A0A9X7J0G2_9FIRM|nr:MULTISPECIES: DUF4912 domain-containing protein [Moorella]PRR70349.1 hypothetical protein MOST_27410 [Moorella stamsii]CEP66199.1 Uncharacterized [Moorella glycerini]CEP66354.1 Uncharacterized [Moorella glycerini]